MTLTFPEDVPHTKVLAEIGEAKLVRLRGSKTVLMINGDYVDIDDGENSIYEKLILYATGNVLEVGLGVGKFSDLARANKKVKSIKTYEKRKGVISLYKKRRGNKKKHVIEEKDATAITKPDKYNFILYDIMFNDNRKDWRKGLKTLRWSKNRLKKNGKIAYPVMPKNFHKEFHKQAMKVFNHYEYVRKNKSLKNRPLYVIYWNE